MYTYIDGVADHPLAMRFVSEKDGQKGLWLVFDTMNGNVVGVHKSETLAVLDAFKREQDTYTCKNRCRRQNTRPPARNRIPAIAPRRGAGGRQWSWSVPEWLFPCDWPN